MAKVTREEIIHIAKLADLNLTETEIKRYTDVIGDILNFAEIINKADTEGLDETRTILNKENVFRKDEVKKEFSRDELMQNAEDVDRGMFRIPKVIN